MTAGELGELAGTTPEREGELSRLGLITATAGQFETGDVRRVRLVEAFEAAGVPAEALARASEQGTISLAYCDELHQEPGVPSARTYGDVVAGLDDRGPSLRRLFGAFGLAEPEPSDRLPGDDEALLLRLLEALEANPDRDLALRAFRVFGESSRRASDAAMSVYAEAVERAAADIAGLPSEAVYRQFLRPWARFARLVPRLSAWLHMRHLSAAIDAWSVQETERLLVQTGFVPDREVGQPAVAFIDLIRVHRPDRAAWRPGRGGSGRSLRGARRRARRGPARPPRQAARGRRPPAVPRAASGRRCRARSPRCPRWVDAAERTRRRGGRTAHRS